MENVADIMPHYAKVVAVVLLMYIVYVLLCNNKKQKNKFINQLQETETEGCIEDSR